MDIKPGDLVVLSCAGASTPLVRVGDRLPIGAPDDQQLAIVVKVEAAQVTLGPLKSGQYSLALPCSNQTSATLDVSLTALKQSDLPEHAPVLAPLGLSYPLWFWIAIALAVVAVTGAGYAVYRKLRKKFKAPPPPVKKIETPADELFATFLRSVEGNPALDRGEPFAVQELYARGTERLRAFLEYRLSFKAGWATTQEFVGILKTVLLRSSSIANLGPIIESMLTQSDLVRFSKDQPEAGARKQYVQQLRDVYTQINRVSTKAANAEGRSL